MNIQSRISHKDFFKSIAFSLLSALCLAIVASSWQYIMQMGAFQITLFIRFFCPFLLLTCWVLIWRIKITVSHFHLYLLRAIVVTASQYAWMYVLINENLVIATLLYLTSGLFSPIVLYIIFGVKTPLKTIIAIIISFIGVVIALGSWNNIMSPGILIGLLSGLLVAIGQVIQHRAVKVSSPIALNLALFGLCALFSLPWMFVSRSTMQASLCFIDNLSWLLVGIILFFSLFSVINQMALNAAYSYVHRASSLVPFFYISILFSGIIDWLWRGIIPQTRVIIGVVIILLGGILMSIRRITPSTKYP